MEKSIITPWEVSGKIDYKKLQKITELVCHLTVELGDNGIHIESRPETLIKD